MPERFDFGRRVERVREILRPDPPRPESPDEDRPAEEDRPLEERVREVRREGEED